MSMFDNLASLGKGYSLITAVVSVFIGIILIFIGNKVRDNPSDISQHNNGSAMMIAGAIIIAVGLGLYYLAQSNKDVAAVAGVWLIVMVMVTIIGAIKGHSNLSVSME